MTVARHPIAAPRPRAGPALVIFDCDGVLVDSERLSHRVLHAMLIELGATISPQQTVERFMERRVVVHQNAYGPRRAGSFAGDVGAHPGGVSAQEEPLAVV